MVKIHLDCLNLLPAGEHEVLESRSHIYDTSQVIYIGPVITTCILPTIHTWYIKTTAHNLVCNLFPVLDFDLAWSFSATLWSCMVAFVHIPIIRVHH